MSDSPDAGPGHGFFDSIRRSGIVRADERWVGGVAGGVARRIGVDPLIVRGVLVVLTVFGGLGLLLYGLGWALLPEEQDGRIHLQEALRGRFDAALAAATVLVIVGLVRPGLWLGGWWSSGWPAAVAIVGAVVVILALVKARPRGSDASPASPPPVPEEPGGTAEPVSTAPPASQDPPEGPVNPYEEGDPADPAPAADLVRVAGVLPVTQRVTTLLPPEEAAPPAATVLPEESWGPPPEPAATATPTEPTPQPEGPPVWSAPAESVPGRPGRRRPRGPGFRLVLLALAGILLGAAAITWWWFTAGSGGPPYPLAMIAGVALGVVGVAIAVAGLLGRRGGALHVLAVPVAIAAVWIGAASLSSPDEPALTWASTSQSQAHQSRVRLDPGNLDLLSTERAREADMLNIDLATHGAQVAAELDGQPLMLSRTSLGSTDITVPSDLPVKLVVTGDQATVYTDSAWGWDVSAERGVETLVDDNEWVLAAGGRLEMSNAGIGSDTLIIEVSAPEGFVHINQDEEQS